MASHDEDCVSTRLELLVVRKIEEVAGFGSLCKHGKRSVVGGRGLFTILFMTSQDLCTYQYKRREIQSHCDVKSDCIIFG